MSRWIAVIATVTLCTVGLGRTAGAESARLIVDGQPRAYLLERPKAPGPVPTIIMLHGANGTAERMAKQSGLTQLGPPDGFAVVFPQSRANIWNRFPPGKESQQALEAFRKFGGPPNDIGFLKMLVADLVRRGISDPGRIYLAGQSNGGFMALRMFCSEGATFAGIGLVVASMPEPMGEECRPAKPLPTLMLTGTADTTVPFRGGPVAPIPPQLRSAFKVWSADRMALYFRKLNGCDGQPERTVLPGQQPQTVEMERSATCTGGPVVAYRVVGGTHGSAPTAVSTGRLLLDFFRDSRSRDLHPATR